MINLKKWFLKNWLYVFIFVFFLYINSLSPLIGDDWEVSTWFPVSANGNILTFIKSIYWSWLNFNGRGLSLLLTSFFGYYKILWNFVSAGMFVFIIYSFSKILGYKKNIIPILLSTFFLLSVSNNIRTEIYSLVCANVGFIVPLVLILIYLIITKQYLIKINKKTLIKYETKTLILISLFCLIISTLMENISAGFTATLTLLNIYIFLKTKRFDKLFLMSFISSLLGSIFMFTSPGMHTSRELYNNSLGLFGTLKLSLSANINLVILENKLIFFIITLITIVAILNNSIYIPKKIIKYFYPSFLFLILSTLSFSIINHYINIPFFAILTNNFIFSLIGFIYLLSFLIPILFIKKNKKSYLFLLFVAIFSLIPASLITQTGARIITITVFIFMGIGCGILNQIKFNSKKIQKIIFWVILSSIFVQINILSVTYRYIYKTQKLRESIINNTLILQHQQLWNYDNYLTIPAFKDGSLYHTANPSLINTKYHYLNFIEYYQLDPKTKVIFK